MTCQPEAADQHQVALSITVGTDIQGFCLLLVDALEGIVVWRTQPKELGCSQSYIFAALKAGGLKLAGVIRGQG